MATIEKIALSVIDKLNSAPHAQIQESHKVLRILDTSIESEPVLRDLRELDLQLRQSNKGECLVTGSISGALDLQTIGLDGVQDESLNVVVKKTSQDGLYYFFTAEGLRDAFQDDDFVSNAREARIMADFPCFSSLTTWFLPWEQDIPKEIDEWKGHRDPRTLVRDLALKATVPNDILPWLLNTSIGPPNESHVLDTWKAGAARRLAYVLPSEIASVDRSIVAIVKGQRSRSLMLGTYPDDRWLSLFDSLHAAAYWVYELHESDVKHALLNFQLALEWPDSEGWPESNFLTTALDNAKEAYRLHYYETSKELLKTHAELRKSLHDEVVRVNQNTRGLVTNLWRDFAIAAGVAALKFSTTKESLSGIGLKILSIATASFILLSLLMTLFSNGRFNKIAKDSRNYWRRKSYGFIEEKDFKELVDEPIAKGLRVYRWVAGCTSAIYLAIIAFLVYLALPI